MEGSPVLAPVALRAIPVLEGNVSILGPSQCVLTAAPLCVPVLGPAITAAPWPYYSCVWPTTHCILPAITPILLHRVKTLTEDIRTDRQMLIHSTGVK